MPTRRKAQPARPTAPTEAGAYWCTYDSMPAIVFIAGQAPLLQISGLQSMDERFEAHTRYVRNVDPRHLKFGSRISSPDVPPTPAQ